MTATTSMAALTMNDYCYNRHLIQTIFNADKINIIRLFYNYFIIIFH